jgi:tetratricopeptide (TPR) repeat protein
MNTVNDHPDWNELAALIDRGADGVRPDVLQHLAGCPACMAAWSAAVEHRDRVLAAATVPEAIPRRVTVVTGGRRRLRPRRGFAWGLGTLAAAALLLLVLLPRDATDPLPTGPQDRLQQRLGGLSHTGLVFPRVHELGAVPVTDYRAGATNGAVIDLTPWAERLAREPADGEAAFWLTAGFLGRGQIDHADDILRRALRTAPQALDLRHLAAIVAYQRSDLDAAVATLAAILRDHPGDALAQLNLAVIAHEHGRGQDHRATLLAIAADDRRPALQARAAQLLQQIAP